MSDVHLYQGAIQPEDVTLRSIGGFLKMVADALSLSDVILANKFLIMTDLMTLSDVPLKDWIVSIADAIQLASEVLSTPERTKFVADLVSFTETASVIWKGKWKTPIQNLYMVLRDQTTKIICEVDSVSRVPSRSIALRVREEE